MTDIAEKLLSLPRVFSNSSPIMKEAADTIAALRTALAATEERAEKAEALVARFVEACGPFVAEAAEWKTLNPDAAIACHGLRECCDQCGDEPGCSEAMFSLADLRALASLTAEAKGE